MCNCSVREQLCSKCEYIPGKSKNQINERRCVDRYKAMCTGRLLRAELIERGRGEYPGEEADAPLRTGSPTRSSQESEIFRSSINAAIQVPAIVVSEAPVRTQKCSTGPIG
jgi:hypothetical protein